MNPHTEKEQIAIRQAERMIADFQRAYMEAQIACVLGIEACRRAIAEINLARETRELSQRTS